MCGDVAADAAIALEGPGLVERRLAGKQQPDEPPVFGRVLHFEIAERLVPGEERPVALPVRLGEVQRRLFPVLVADERERIGFTFFAAAAGDAGAAKLGGLLPVPGGNQLQERGLLACLRIGRTVGCGPGGRPPSPRAAMYPQTAPPGAVPA